jgi:hypothetical protein
MASMQHHMQQAEDSLLHVTHLHRHAPSWQVCAQRGLVRPGSPTLAIHSPGLYTRLRTTRQKGTATEPTPLLPHHLGKRVTRHTTLVCGAGSRGPINWEDVERFFRTPLPRLLRLSQEGFDAFVTGGAAEAEAFFRNKGEPVHCLSTRFEGVNYRASMLIGMASVVSKRYIAIYNPNFYNQFTKRVGADLPERAQPGLGFWKALEHTKRTGGCLIQVGCALTLEPCGPVLLEDPARGLPYPWRACWLCGSRCRNTTRTGSTVTCKWRRR